MLSPGAGGCFLFSCFVVGLLPPPTPTKYLPDLDSKNLTSRTQSLVSHVPHSPDVLLPLRKFQLLILPNSLQSGSALRGECFFSSPGVSFQVEWLPPVLTPRPPSTCCSTSLFLLRKERKWWVRVVTHLPGEWAREGYTFSCPRLEQGCHSEHDSALFSCPECWRGRFRPLGEKEGEHGDT